MRRLRRLRGYEVARFVCLRWTPIDREGERQGRKLAQALGEGWSVLLDWRGVLVMTSDASEVVAIDRGRGFAFGQVYDREGATLSAGELSGDPEAWANKYWGAFVAIVIDRGCDLVHILRDASGSLACFHADLDQVHVVFSDAEDIVRMAPDLQPDLGFLAAFLRYPKIVVRRTALAGVSEIWPGERVTFARTTLERHQFWAPETFHKRGGSFAHHIENVRRAAEFAVTARSKYLTRVAHRLSGGLDSAIVLGLAHKDAPHLDIICVNEFWEQAVESDERTFARETAERAGCTLIELNMDPDRIRYERALNAPLTAKPTLATLSFADPDIAAFFTSLDVEAILSGQGGDHIFHRTRSPLIAADALGDAQALRQVVRTTIDTARLCGRSVWDVAGAVLASLLTREAAPFANRDPLGVLSHDIEPADSADHAWLGRLKSWGPARRRRVWHLLDALAYHDRSVVTGIGRSLPLLLSQPIIEACLATPPYIMTDGGKERALARHAFSDLIPERVAERTMKGETTRYFATILANNRNWIRDVLLNGEAVHVGLVDGERMQAALNRDWRQDGMATGALYPLLAVEIWLRALRRSQVHARPSA